MKIRSDIHAGTTALEACQAERDYWKAKATYMEQIAKGPGYSPQPPYYPPSPSQPTSGGGYVGGVYYPDKSGVCG
jgi:hypothetical protein